MYVVCVGRLYAAELICFRTPKIIMAANTIMITPLRPATPLEYVGVVIAATVVFSPGSRLTPMYTKMAARIRPKIICTY